MPEANGMILAKEEENDAEVRREDQDQINEFGRLNARLHEVRDEVGKLKVSILYWYYLVCTFIIMIMHLSHFQLNDILLNIDIDLHCFKKYIMQQYYYPITNHNITIQHNKIHRNSWRKLTMHPLN